MSDPISHPELLRLTVEVVTAHAAHNTLPAETLPKLIRDIYAAMSDVDPSARAANTPPANTPPANTPPANTPPARTPPADVKAEAPNAEIKPAAPATPAPEPAVPVKNSVFRDHIICLEDGLKLKMLKRHLHSAHGMTPQDYRRKWNLPDTYPIVAPSHAALRSKIAQSIDFGRKSKTPPAVVEVQRIPEGVSAKRKRGRPRKA